LVGLRAYSTTFRYEPFTRSRFSLGGPRNWCLAAITLTFLGRGRSVLAGTEATALAITLAGDKSLQCRTGAQLREPGAQRFLNFQASEVVKEPPLTRIVREMREMRRREAERPQRITALFVRVGKQRLMLVCDHKASTIYAAIAIYAAFTANSCGEKERRYVRFRAGPLLQSGGGAFIIGTPFLPDCPDRCEQFFDAFRSIPPTGGWCRQKTPAVGRNG
jgi:hypothetical protein